MPATSISIRKVNTFKLNQSKITLEKAGVNLGSIEKVPNGSLTINKMSFEHYIGKYNKHIIDDIVVYDNDISDYVEYNAYNTSQSFDIFYCSSKKILLSQSSTPITKKFLKLLKKELGDDFEYNTPHFEFQKISDQMPETRGIRFSSSDVGVTNKSFSGDEVDVNNEVTEALESDDATQLIGKLDLQNKERTILLTQSGTIVSFSKIDDINGTFKMLQLAIDFLQKFKLL